jgi:hypothetical protein
MEDHQTRTVRIYADRSVVRPGYRPPGYVLYYPALSLDQVYGAITFYLGSQEDVEGTFWNASAKRMLSPLPIQHLPKSGRRLSVCGSKPFPDGADGLIRFLTGASLHDGVTGCLRREPAIDFLSAHEATLEGVPDPEVLAFATRQNRISRHLRSHNDASPLRSAMPATVWFHIGQGQCQRVRSGTYARRQRIRSG